MASTLLLLSCAQLFLLMHYVDIAKAAAEYIGPAQSLGNWGIDPVPQSHNASAITKPSAADPCSVVNGDCQHICIPTPTGRVCSCWPGYYLEKDGVNCYDMVTARDGAAYCIDMSEKVAFLPRDSSYVQWLKKPTKNRRGCSLQGVVRIMMPPWAKHLWFNFAFSKTTGYSFHIADSKNNVANRRKKGSDRYDAEVFGLQADVTINKNQYGTKRRSGLLTKEKDVLLSHALQVRIWRNRVMLNNYMVTRRPFSGQLFRVNASIEDDYVYLGLNRIVSVANGRATKRRAGRGLCHVCIYFR